MLLGGRSLMVNIIVGMIVEVKVENAPRVGQMDTVVQKIRVTVMVTVLKKCHKQFWSHHGAMKPITCVSLRLLRKRALIGQLKKIGIVVVMILLQIHTYLVSLFISKIIQDHQDLRWIGRVSRSLSG